MRAHLQRVVHLLERLFSLLEETEDDRPGEFAVVLFIIHLQDLLESHGINALAQVKGDRSLVALSSVVSQPGIE